MEYDFAIVYFGLTRSTKKVFNSHLFNVYQQLDKHNLTYKKFMHTWRTKDDSQKIWEETIPQKIDYEEYKLLNPDVYKIESQEEFLDSINMDDYFYKDIWETFGPAIWNPDGTDSQGEWLPGLVKNHLCALESSKRCFEIVEKHVKNGDKFKYIMFIRPDVLIHNLLPLHEILPFNNKIHIPNYDHYAGLNDRFAIMNYENAFIYGKRINEIAEFRKTQGRIVSEIYVKYIINKYKMELNFINFVNEVIRP